MKPEAWFEGQLAEWDSDPDFILEGVLLASNERICEIMERRGISRAELARRLGKSRAYVTRLLNGLPNLTLKTLTRIAIALGEGIEVFLPSSVTEERRRAVEAAAEARRYSQIATQKAQWRIASDRVVAARVSVATGENADHLAIAS